MNSIDAIFDNLDKWRHYPNYQLERRADIFFSIYLPDILHHRFGYEIEGIIPEFPIRIGEISSNESINKSFKIDYVVKVKNEKRIILIELKTDDASRRPEQDCNLKKALSKDFDQLLEGVKKIYDATDYKEKYKHLLNELERLGFIQVENGEHIRIVKDQYQTRLVYIQPNVKDDNELSIGFEEIADIIEKRKDPLSLRFSRSLREWRKSKAGEK
jgi:hypothetical protein